MEIEGLRIEIDRAPETLVRYAAHVESEGPSAPLGLNLAKPEISAK